MANLLSYVDAVQYDSFYDLAPTTLDILALTEITYLPFDGIDGLSQLPNSSFTLAHLQQQFTKKYQNKYPAFGMVTDERLSLVDKLARFKRFKHIKPFAYINEYNLEVQKQFAAMTFQIRPKEYVVVFRGTDDTIIGWKEDFHMAYMAEIPAQEAARKYLTTIMNHLTGTFTLAGHSKGGNLAMYAATTIDAAKQEKIQKIYSFDAPGLHSSIIQSQGFQAISSKIQSIIPEHSIVGLLLETPKNAIIVKSKGNGLLQHISFNWVVEGTDFLTAPSLKPDSIQIDQTLKSWMAHRTAEELRDFFDLFFGLFLQAGILRFSDFTVDTSAKIQQLIANKNNLTPEQTDMMRRLIRLLIDTRIQIWKQSLPTFKPEKT